MVDRSHTLREASRDIPVLTGVRHWPRKGIASDWRRLGWCGDGSGRSRWTLHPLLSRVFWYGTLGAIVVLLVTHSLMFATGRPDGSPFVHLAGKGNSERSIMLTVGFGLLHSDAWRIWPVARPAISAMVFARSILQHRADVWV